MRNYYFGYKDQILEFYKVFGNWGFLKANFRVSKNILIIRNNFKAISGQNSKNILTYKK